MNRRALRVAETRETLARRFPQAIKPKREHKQPLAIGIHRQVFEAAPDLPRGLVREAISDYCRGFKYLAHVETGKLRVNLDGSPASVISIEQAAFARAAVEKLQKSWKTKKRRPAPRKVA